MPVDFDVVGARQAGYSDDEIAAHLSQQSGFDKDAAEKAGYTPTEIINHLSPSAKDRQSMADTGAKAAELFGRDPSKAGKLTAGDYATRAAAGAATGGVIGAGIGAISGPGAIVTGTVGAIGGAVSGLLEAGAEDLGFGEGTQFAAGLISPGAGLSTKVGQMIEKKAADYASKYATKAILKSMDIPFAGPIVKGVGEFLEKRKPADYKAVGQALGEEAKTLGVGSTKNIDEANAALRQAHPDITVPEGKSISHSLYEDAKQSYDNVAFPKGKQGSTFLDSPEFKALHGDIPSKKDAYSEFFTSDKGNPLTGDKVVENLKFSKDATATETQNARKAFNDYLQRTTSKRSEELARNAYETERVALAKDTLPTLFQNNAGTAIKDQLQNLSKNPEGIKVFNQEFVNYLKGTTAPEAKKMWGTIGPEVKKQMKLSDKVYNNITDIMNNAQTPQDISRAMRLFVGATTAGAIAKEKNL
jgi:hypothetical protein